eukprot:CAMPEP_0119350386 /NCGR_PEP_ID=MMETSP1333-20130426/110035_1 /TAXON_ID=418940 /ORGANISM="Scyphosphaera apsteinii, Strain RCC1455" /LENGTH=88 /DNA_ID=CAMNT_0007363003 /DNA_START=314 /DNA_END=580 /DNA_ORIENTATION=+
MRYWDSTQEYVTTRCCSVHRDKRASVETHRKLHWRIFRAAQHKRDVDCRGHSEGSLRPNAYVGRGGQDIRSPQHRRFCRHHMQLNTPC